MSNGWIAIPRRIEDHWLWQQPRKFQNFLKLVMLANYKESTVVFGNGTYKVRRGQLAMPLRQLAKKLDCTKQTVLTFLELLQRCGMIEKETIDSKFTMLTILNYDEFSPKGAEGEEEDSSHEESAKMTNVEKSTSEAKTDNKEEESDAKEVEDGENGASDDTLKSEKSEDSRHKLDHIQEINNISSSTACARMREGGERFFKDIRENEQFWIDTSDLLKTPIPKLKELAEDVFLKSRRAMDDFEASYAKNRRYLVNSLRRAVEREQRGQEAPSEPDKNKPNYNGNNNTQQTDCNNNGYVATNDRQRRQVELAAYIAQNLGSNANAPGSHKLDF